MDAQAVIIQLIISGSGIIGSIIAVILILAKKLGNGSPQSNGQKRIDDGFQKQVDSGVDDTRVLCARYDSHIAICDLRWLAQAKDDGRIDAYMVEIRDRLARLESKIV